MIGCAWPVSEKQADILANYGQEIIYTFYSAGDEIVFVLSNAGP
jgi:hypothetical protein